MSVMKYLKQWKVQEESLSKQTSHYRCLICFKKINTDNVFFLVNQYQYVCKTCLKNMNPHIIKLEISNVKGYAIYPYESVRNLLYQFKGCFDYVLKDAFFSPYALFIRLRYWNYYIVPIPSYKSHDEERGYNHVEEMIKVLHINVIKCIEKSKDVKQSSLHYQDRIKASENFVFVGNENQIRGKKILIVDDVITTSSTMKACISLVKNYHPKKIAFLSMSYTCRDLQQFVDG